MGKSESTPSALWVIMPVMPIMAARPLLRSALSLNFFTSGSSYLGRRADQLRAASPWGTEQQRGAARTRCSACSTTRPNRRTPWGRDGARLMQANQEAARNAAREAALEAVHRGGEAAARQAGG